MRTRQSGLTLVELMIVVAVMAIIAAVAYPLYTAQTQKARRADAKVALESLALAEERFYTIFGRYGTVAQLDDPNNDGNNGDSFFGSALANLDRDNDGTPDNYAIAVVATTTTFTVTATAQGAQTDDTGCAAFTIDQIGNKGGGANCWR